VAGIPEPGAMALATATPDGRPSVRMVLLRSHGEHGFVFYTHYRSRKARELAANPVAALALHWYELGRQVRIEGAVSRIRSAESAAYFRERPVESRLGAWASPQSEVIEDRGVLDTRFRELVERYRHQAIPRPPHWGGFRLVPDSFEFWQARLHRLHDRLRYSR